MSTLDGFVAVISDGAVWRHSVSLRDTQTIALDGELQLESVCGFVVLLYRDKMDRVGVLLSVEAIGCGLKLLYIERQSGVRDGRI